MLLRQELERTFLFEDKGQQLVLSDPFPALSPDAILNHYSQLYPILTTAKIEGPEIRDDEVQYKFVTTIGTKG